MNIPSTLLYSKDHEWIKVEGKQATLGVTDFAQSQLGDVVFVEVPALDTELAAGDGIGTIESVKAVSRRLLPCQRQSCSDQR
jgi:glycine cleavage system H protein